MSVLPETPQTFTRIFLNALRFYFPVLKKTFLLIVLITLVINICLYLELILPHKILRYSIDAITLLILIYLWAGMLQLTHAYFHGKSLALKSVFINCFNRALPIYLTVLCYTLGILIILALVYLMLWLVIKIWGHDLNIATLALAFLVGAPLLYVLVLTYFAFPLVVFEERRGKGKEGKRTGYAVFSVFREAVLITGPQWFQAFGVYVFSVLILMLLWPHTAIGQWMWHRRLTILYDFIVLLVLLPIQANLIVFTLHDLKLRWQKS